jgi:trehalose/maltose hydrolase-like predicted phosphorylase
LTLPSPCRRPGRSAQLRWIWEDSIPRIKASLVAITITEPSTIVPCASKTKVIKQADVVALLGLLPEEFAGDHADANFRYYEPRCGHGSSLSGAMHGLVAARLGYSDLALRYFESTLRR